MQAVGGWIYAGHAVANNLSPITAVPLVVAVTPPRSADPWPVTPGGIGEVPIISERPTNRIHRVKAIDAPTLGLYAPICQIGRTTWDRVQRSPTLLLCSSGKYRAARCGENCISRPYASSLSTCRHLGIGPPKPPEAIGSFTM
jgi:hypothetical protein